MSEDRNAQVGRLAQGAMNGLLAECRAEDGTSYIDPVLARQALVACLASIIEADAIDPTSDLKEIIGIVSEEFRMQTEALRSYFEATGAHSGWDARPVKLQ